MVSVLCLAYNHVNYIEKTIESIISQKTNFKFEIVIHDDASTDGTTEIIREYEKKYPDLIKLIYQTENQYSKAVPITYTYLYPNARGKYVAFCECDDFWIDDNKLQKQVDFLEQNPGFVACVHKYIVVDKNNNQQDIKTFGYYEEEGTYSLADFEKNELPSQLASLVCRNIFLDDKNGYPKTFLDVKLAGDVKTYLYLLANGDIFRMGETMSVYRFVQEKGGNSWSSRNYKKIKGYSDWKNVRLLEKKFYENYGKKINLKERKSACALSVAKNFIWQPNLKNFRNLIVVIILQRGLLKKLYGELFRCLKKR